MRVVALIQARLGSSRLPGKVLQDLAGEPMLARCVSRTCRATTVHGVVIVTTVRPGDDALAVMCEARGWPCFRGSEDDVLDRYYRAAVAHGADVVVRITSDCPLIDPEVIDRIVSEFLARQPEVDYASNVIPRRTFPRGLDTEVLSFAALESAWKEDANPAWREHVTAYVVRAPGRYRIHNVCNDEDYSSFRCTVDTLEDLALVRRIYEHFGHDRFSWREAVALLQRHAEWLDLNRGIQQKAV
jgi:spore coat polysaccharide biosynthesis protein SpsF